MILPKTKMVGLSVGVLATFLAHPWDCMAHIQDLWWPSDDTIHTSLVLILLTGDRPIDMHYETCKHFSLPHNFTIFTNSD
jgi:hypothetical protein